MAFQLPEPKSNIELLQEALRRRLEILGQPTPWQTLAPTIAQAGANIDQGIAGVIEQRRKRKIESPEYQEQLAKSKARGEAAGLKEIFPMGKPTQDVQLNAAQLAAWQSGNQAVISKAYPAGTIPISHVRFGK